MPRIYEVRHGTAENLLTDPARVTDAEVAWYMDHAVFLVATHADAVQGFVCANPLTGYVWALFVIDAAQGRGFGAALLDAAMQRLRAAGNRQSFLTTGAGSRAERFYVARGWQAMGLDHEGDAVYRLWL